MRILIPHSVTALQAPFHAVYTAEEAQAYKPHMRAFEYMLDHLGCGPEDVLHCSSSFRYDHMTADDLGFQMKAFINRGHEPVCSGYNVQELKDLGGLPDQCLSNLLVSRLTYNSTAASGEQALQ